MAWINCHDFLYFTAKIPISMYYRSVLLMWMHINCTQANCAQPITALKKTSYAEVAVIGSEQLLQFASEPLIFSSSML